MSEGKCPSGLVVLAVLNFLFGANAVLSAVGMLFFSKLFNFLASQHDDPEMHAIVRAWDAIGDGVFYTTFVLTLVVAALLIASGVGFLTQKRFLGRTLGNLCALLSIASSLVWAYGVESEEIGGGWSLIVILGLVYPVLSLVLLNTTFKEDFVR